MIMKMKNHLLTPFLFTLFVLVLLVVGAKAETRNCTPITTLPYTITFQGAYCLTGNLETNMTDGNAVTINTNNVVLDLNGYKIGGLAGGPDTNANGIYANQRKNITIRNGTLRGFARGIFLEDISPYTTSQGHIIERIRADMNNWMGIFAIGRGIIIRNNQVVSTGGLGWAHGIFVRGPGARIINNDIIETKRHGSLTFAQAIEVDHSDGTVIEKNRIGNESADSQESAIFMVYSQDLLVENNRMTNLGRGLDWGADSTGKYRNNIATCIIPYIGGGTDAGNND
jgi:hypothetical protein